MKFGPVSLDQAQGKILAHNVTAPGGRRALRKGHPLSGDDVALLRELGRTSVYVAELEPGDVTEDEAAGRIGRMLQQSHVSLRGPSTGRSNLYAESLGLVRLDVGRLHQMNHLDGVTLATLPNHTVVDPGRMIATLKILPYAVPDDTVRQAEEIASEPLLRLDPLPPRRVSLILSGSPYARERVVNSFEKALGRRLKALGSELVHVEFVSLEEKADETRLAERLRLIPEEEVDLVILAGETAISDRHDIAPSAVESAGGTVVGFGAPVDPGNLLMLAYLGTIPVVGAPGCSRSPKDNIVDLVLPRLLAGHRLTSEDIVAWGHGGLLEDVPERPLPRSKIE